MIIRHDLTEAVIEIARAIAGGGRFETRYSSPAWTAELTRADGRRLEAAGATASVAIAELGRKAGRAR